MNTFQIRCLVNMKCTLGEGPVWDGDRHLLYWVDILEKKIYRYNFSDDSVLSWSTPEYVGFIILKQNNHFIAGLKSGLYHVILNEDGTIITSLIDRIDENVEHIRFNDGMYDSQGNIWACTMDMRNKEPLGKYFCYDHDLKRTVIDEGYIVANGPALSPDGELLYTVETVGNKQLGKGVYVTHLQPNVLLKKKELLIDWSYQPSLPDGIITDSKGNLWIGEFNGNILRSYSPDGRLIYEIPLSAWNVTKPVLGGENMDILYVTSARLGTNENVIDKYPDTGGIIEVKGIYT